MDITKTINAMNTEDRAKHMNVRSEHNQKIEFSDTNLSRHFRLDDD